MDEMRKPFFVAAIILALLCIGVEAGSAFWQRSGVTEGRSLSVEDPETRKLLEDSREEPSPPRPGMGIASLVALDVLVLFSLSLMVSSFLLTDNVTGRIQGCVTLITALLMLLGCVAALFTALGKTLLMLGLFCSPPFGTAAYALTWGFFDTEGAAVTLGILVMLKLAFGACLLLANQRFAKNKGMILFLLTTVVATFIVQFCHALVPGILASITDGVAAIVILVLAIIWLIAMLFGSVISVVKAIV